MLYVSVHEWEFLISCAIIITISEWTDKDIYTVYQFQKSL